MRRWFLVLVSLLCLSFLCAAPEELHFTQEEIQFIADHPTIRFGVDPSFVPFEFVNDAGEHHGISSDIITYIEEQTGLDFELQQNLSWQEVTEKAKIREIDVLPAVGKTDERESYLLFSNPYITFQRVAIVKSTNQSIKTFKDLFGRQVAVQANSSHYGYLKNYPQITLRTYDTVEEALLAVNRGDEIVFVGNEATTSYIAGSRGITELSFIPLASNEESQLHIAVRDDWPQLITIVNKALDSLSDAEFSQIYQNWISFNRRVDYTQIIRIAIVIGLVVVIIFGVSIFWIVRLKREIGQKEIAQKEAESATERAIAADKEKSRFMARMSHEIRTPLNGIHGMTYLLEGTNLDAQQQRFLSTILQASQNMLTIINDIIEFSRIEERQIILERVPFKFDEIIQHVISLQNHTIQEKNLIVQLEWSDDVPVHVIGDGNRLGQIFTNLIHNAIKFTENGIIGIRIFCSERTESHCSVICEISDTGIGMSAEEQSDLFKPFSQADASIARRFGGSGLGLSIVKSLVELMGGSISVMSERGKGSTFTFTLPLELDLPGIADDERRLAATQLSSMPMLILAKEEITRKAIEVVLRRIGAPGDYIGSSQLAVQLMTFKNASHESRYQLIIVDYAVDRGVELLLAALQDQFSVHQKPKVVVFLDHDDAKLGKRLRDLGAEVILPKPVLPSLVFNSLLDLFTDTVMKSLSVQSIEHVAEMDGVSLSILVVEDNAVNRTIAKEILERAGFSVILAENGAIGYEKFIENKDVISLILMDLHMDVMDGFEATEKIRLVDATTPIFALTADVVGDIRVRCRNAGFTRIITKPYNPAKLIHHIVETIGNSMKHATKVSEEFHFLDIEKGVRRVDGDTALYKKIVRIFSQEMEDDVMQLLDHVKSEQWQQMGLLAHKIKGSAEAIGAERLAHCARQLQEIIKLENGDIPDALQSLSFEVSQVRNEIQSFLT